MNPTNHRFPIFLLLIAFACTLTASGCRLCADCDLESFPSYGGAWQRTVRDSGRVGSVFDPGGSRSADLSARIDAETAEANLRDRSADGGSSAGKESDDASQADSKDGDKLKPQGSDLESSDLEDDEKLKQMEDRLRGLELQDINYRSPPAESEEWR